MQAENIVPEWAQETFNKVSEKWNAHTSASPEWDKSCPEAGQCAVTAMYVQDVFGGELLRALVNGESHYWNRINGEEVDFTRAQFTANPTIEDVVVRERSYLEGSSVTVDRYQNLVGSIKVSSDNLTYFFNSPEKEVKFMWQGQHKLQKTVTFLNEAGQAHSDNGPAIIIYLNFVEEVIIYCQYGDAHRIDGPAVYFTENSFQYSFDSVEQCAAGVWFLHGQYLGSSRKAAYSKCGVTNIEDFVTISKLSKINFDYIFKALNNNVKF